MTGLIAVFKNSDGVTTSIVTKRGTHSYESKCDTINSLMKDFSVEPVGFLILNDETSFYSKRLKAGLSDLQTYSDYHKRYIKSLEELNYDKKSLEDIDRVMRENEEVLMKKVAWRVSSCLARDIEVDSDLAHECYNWYNNIKLARYTG